MASVFAGSSIVFYESDNKKIKPLDKLELRHYDPEERAVVFIAGNEKLTREIMNLLLKFN